MRILYHIIDFLFPPSAEELKIRGLSAESFAKVVRKSTPTEYSFIKSLFSYKDPLVRELVWQIKYRKNKHALHLAGQALFESLDRPALLVPIPISKKRRKERGYNQCELLIDEIMKCDVKNEFKKDYNLLVRAKHIDKQTLKNRSERIENTKNIFEVTSKENLSKKIIIIDDVSTTGSTLKEARNELLKTGYLDVKAVTIAH